MHRIVDSRDAPGHNFHRLPIPATFVAVFHHHTCFLTGGAGVDVRGHVRVRQQNSGGNRLRAQGIIGVRKGQGFGPDLDLPPKVPSPGCSGDARGLELPKLSPDKPSPAPRPAPRLSPPTSMLPRRSFPAPPAAVITSAPGGLVAALNCQRSSRSKVATRLGLQFVRRPDGVLQR